MSITHKSKDVTEDPRYHNTWRLLREYRDVVWSLELSVLQLKNQFHVEYGCDVDEFLDSIYSAGADLGGTEIEQYARCVERTNKMLKLLQGAVTLLRSKHKDGESLYWVLYYTYLSPQRLENVNEILEQDLIYIFEPLGGQVCVVGKEAVHALSSILWGYTTRDNLKLLEDFIPTDGSGSKLAADWQ